MFEAFKRLFRSQCEHEFRRRAGRRERLADAEFAARFFPGIDQDIPVTVASTVRKQLRVDSIRPSDNLASAFPDIPFIELALDIIEELEFDPQSFEFGDFDGTVRNLVDELAKRKERG